MKKPIPVGVGIISIGEIVWGSLLLAFSGLALRRALFPGGGDNSGLGFVVGPIAGVIATFILITGILTFKLKPSGRVLNFIFSSLAMILAIASPGLSFFVLFPVEISSKFIFQMTPIDPRYPVAAIFLLIIIYFTRPKVSIEFRGHNT